MAISTLIILGATVSIIMFKLAMYAVIVALPLYLLVLLK